MILIIQFSSNTMRKGIHDTKLIEIMKEQTSYTINASNTQIKKFFEVSKELNSSLVKQITSKSSEKQLILMCGNRNTGFQSILDHLI